MRNNTKKISLAVLALTAVSLASVAGLSVREAAAENTTLMTYESLRIENVSIRLATADDTLNGGFRFETLIEKGKYDALTNVTEVGTLFVPAGFNVADTSIALDAEGNALHEKVQKVVLEGGTENRRGGLLTTDENGAEVISYRAYINNLPATAYYAEVTARSYVIADGVAYYTQAVNYSVGGVATKAYYDVQNEADDVYAYEVAEGWYSPFVEAQRNEIATYVKTTEKAYADKYIKLNGNIASVDLTKLAIDGEDVVGLQVDGKYVEWSVDDNDVLAYATTAGEKTLSIATTKGVYSVPMIQADQVITTGEQFYNWTESWGSAKYTVLANNITAKATTHWIHGGTFPTDYVFNGLGYTIDKFTSGKGIVESLNGNKTTWKNVNYTNYSGDLVFYVGLGGTFENVNVTGTVSNKENLLVYTINRENLAIKNCLVNVSNQIAGTALNLGKKGGGGFNDIALIDTTIIYANAQLNVPETLDLSKGSNYNLYDIDDVQTNYYAKVSGGTATFALSQMGENAPTTVSKLLVNGTEVQATVADGKLTYPATNTGSTALMLTTDKGFRVMNIVHADNVIMTWDEFVAWGTVSIDTYKQYAYTVLGNDIENPAGVTIQFISRFYKIFDGLGHTIKNFRGDGILRRLDNGATWKNVKYTGYTMVKKGAGILGDYLNGGIFENIEVTGSFQDGLGVNCFLAVGANVDTTVISNCTFTMTGDTATTKYLYAGTPHHYKVTISDSTFTYTNGTINYKTCDCGKADATKSEIKNSTINGEYIALKESGK